MSRIFGPIAQAGYIVRNLDEAVKHWTEVLGVGPFFVTPLEFEYYRFRGESSSPKLRLAFGYSGDLQIELIEQVNDAPSAYKAWLDDNAPGGLHHVCMFCEDYDRDTVRFEQSGLTVLMEGKTAAPDNSGIRFKFYDTAIHNGSLIEVADIPLANRAGLEFMQKASVGWDGTDPVRMFG